MTMVSRIASHPRGRRLRRADPPRPSPPGVLRHRCDLILGSDSQGIRRIAEVVCRAWQLADKMKRQRSRLPEETARIGNERIRRYVAKYDQCTAAPSASTPTSARLEDGKMADVVLWRPAFFGIKPELVKVRAASSPGGAMGDSAASLMTCEP